MKKILHVVGARPNFVKVAPVFHALRGRDLKQTVVHTGQHYDANMSGMFFLQLEMPSPDVNLEVGSGTHAVQTAEVMRRLEPVLVEQKPDLVLVYGDVNSTMAAALVCSKLLIPVGHVEAGLRSFDRTMPEEINRLVTDSLSEYLFTPSEAADENLKTEGVAADRIHRVGNVMIDSLQKLLPTARSRVIDNLPESYALLTLHRPSNVDDSEMLVDLMRSLAGISQMLDIVFPVHPRTKERLSKLACGDGRVLFLDPLPYLEFLALEAGATVVITDSGGIQEETTYLGVPCLTLRENTERPITVSVGTNILVGKDRAKLHREVQRVLSASGKKGMIPPLWDGHAAERIADIIAK